MAGVMESHALGRPTPPRVVVAEEVKAQHVAGVSARGGLQGGIGLQRGVSYLGSFVVDALNDATLVDRQPMGCGTRSGNSQEQPDDHKRRRR